LKLQGRFGHLHAEHIGQITNFCQRAMADDWCRIARGFDHGRGRENLVNHGGAVRLKTVAQTL